MPTSTKSKLWKKPRTRHAGVSGMITAAALAPRDVLAESEAGRNQTPTTLFKQQGTYKAIEAFEEALGGREAMVQELLTSPDLSDPIRKVLTLILDPRFGQESLGYLCASAGVAPGEVFAAFRDATVAKANIHALRLVAARLPEITLKVIEAALGAEISCPKCYGVGMVDKRVKDKLIEAVCPACHGTKVIKQQPDPDRQDRILELVGLLKGSGSAISITNQQQNNVAIPTEDVAGGAGLAQLQQAVSSLLFARPAVIDVTPTAPAGPPIPEGFPDA